MGMYYGLLAMICFIAVLSRSLKDKNSRNAFVVISSGVLIVVLQGLRHPTVGTDIQTYLYAVDLSQNLKLFGNDGVFNFDIGFAFLIKLFAKLEISDVFILFIFSGVIISPILYTVYRKSKSPFLSIVIFICLGLFAFTFSGIRQSIALALTFYAFKFIEERKILKFAFCVTVAALFHQTAIVFFIAYPLYSVVIKRSHIWITFVGMIVIYVFRAQIYVYVHSVLRGYSPSLENTGAYTMLFFLIVVYVFSYVFSVNAGKDRTFLAYRNYILIAIVIQLFASVSNTIMRAGFYYYIFIILLIPELLTQQKNNYLRLIITVLVIGISIFFFQYQTGRGYLDVSPYRFFWE